MCTLCQPCALVSLQIGIMAVQHILSSDLKPSELEVGVVTKDNPAFRWVRWEGMWLCGRVTGAEVYSKVSYFNCPFVLSPHSYPMCCSMQNAEWTRNWSPPHCYSREGLTQSLHVSSAVANVSWIAGLIVNYSCNNCHGFTMECSYIHTYPMHRPSLLSSFSPSLRMSYEVYSSPCLLALAYVK